MKPAHEHLHKFIENPGSAMTSVTHQQTLMAIDHARNETLKEAISIIEQDAGIFKETAIKRLHELKRELKPQQ